MMQVSPGYLHSSFKLLDLISKREHQLSSLVRSFERIGLLPATTVVNFVLCMGWLQSDVEGRAAPSLAGQQIQDLRSAPERFRQALLDYINVARPSWSQLTPRGRTETLSALSPEIWQCFAEAGLVVGTSVDVVRWWDKLAASARGQHNESQLEIGRSGERLTLRYELLRTGRQPRWQSIETNLSGFDVLSVVSTDDDQMLRIEVKATSQLIKFGTFHISRNEWNVSCLSDQYAFHLWLLKSNPPSVAVVTRQELSSHVPEERGSGLWESVSIPASSFEGQFQLFSGA